jgi:arylsulfatase A-like enzyme
VRTHALAVLALLLTLSLLPETMVTRVTAQTRPNFVVIVTDDMRASDWVALPKTRALLSEHGTRFDNFFVTTSLCCPSRASILTGQYVHNHGVTFDWSQFGANGLDADTFAWALDEAGYETALIGKYLNGMPEEGGSPPGWDRFLASAASHGNGSYYDVVLNENGERTQYPEQAYEVDILSEKAQTFLEALDPSAPFLLYFAPKAPHVPVIPEERYLAAFANAAVERTPDFNEEDVSDKPLHIRSLPLLDATLLDDLQGKRLRTLLSVDDAIAGIWDTLEATHRLDDTYLFVLSDNGFTVGHHRRIGKTSPYDGSVRIPMYAYGPGFVAGASDERLVANIDIAPTIAEAAGVPLPEADGFSLLQPTTRDALLLEWRYDPFAPPSAATPVPPEVQREIAEEDLRPAAAEADPGKGDKKSRSRRNKDKDKDKNKDTREVGFAGNGIATGEVPEYLGLRTLDTLYVVYRTGERELYRYDSDPYELDNLLADWEGHTPSSEAEALAATLSARMEQLHDCAGSACR